MPLVQSILNNTPLERLGDRCPLTAFTALPADSPLLAVKLDINGQVETRTLEEARARQVIYIQDMHTSIDDMHKEISGPTSKSRKRSIDSHNRKTNVRECNFDVGDFILRGLSKKNAVRKLNLRWTGPFQFTKVMSDFLFEIQDLRSKKKSVVHGTRIKFFRNKSFEVTEECTAQLAFEQNEYCVVEEIQDIRTRAGVIQLLVK